MELLDINVLFNIFIKEICTFDNMISTVNYAMEMFSKCAKVFMGLIWIIMQLIEG